MVLDSLSWTSPTPQRFRSYGTVKVAGFLVRVLCLAE